MLGEQGATDVLTVNALMVTMGPRRGREQRGAAPSGASAGRPGPLGGHAAHSVQQFVRNPIPLL